MINFALFKASRKFELQTVHLRATVKEEALAYRA